MSLTLAEINQLLPNRSDDSLATIQDTDRTLAPHLAANIHRYRAETDNWILGAITLPIAPDAVTYQDGLLTICPDACHPLRIIDGQHRHLAIANPLAGQSQTDSETGPLRDAIASLDSDQKRAAARRPDGTAQPAEPADRQAGLPHQPRTAQRRTDHLPAGFRNPGRITPDHEPATTRPAPSGSRSAPGCPECPDNGRQDYDDGYFTWTAACPGCPVAEAASATRRTPCLMTKATNTRTCAPTALAPSPTRITKAAPTGWPAGTNQPETAPS